MTFPCISKNDLAEFSFIGGTYQQLTFTIIDSASAAYDLSSATCTWRLSEYGSASTILLKSGSITVSPVNTFIVTLEASDTIDLTAGVYQQQPIVEDVSGNQFRPSQGKVNIWKANN